jgi:hypothetical protein
MNRYKSEFTSFIKTCPLPSVADPDPEIPVWILIQEPNMYFRIRILWSLTKICCQTVTGCKSLNIIGIYFPLKFLKMFDKY